MERKSRVQVHTWDAKPSSIAIKNAVGEQVGHAAAPHKIILVSEIPSTYSGKYMQKLLRQLIVGDQVADSVLQTISNSHCLPTLMQEISSWRAGKIPIGVNSVAESYVAPRNDAEERMCSLWA